MRNRTLYLQWTVVAFALIGIISSVARAWTEFPVATSVNDEEYPAISGDKVVWQVYNRWYGDHDIMGADIADPHQPLLFTIAQSGREEMYPAIDGNDVVWQYQYSPGGL